MAEFSRSGRPGNFGPFVYTPFLESERPNKRQMADTDSGIEPFSPIVWDDRIFVVTATSGGKDEGLRVGLYGETTKFTDYLNTVREHV